MNTPKKYTDAGEISTPEKIESASTARRRQRQAARGKHQQAENPSEPDGPDLPMKLVMEMLEQLNAKIDNMTSSTSQALANMETRLQRIEDKINVPRVHANNAAPTPDFEMKISYDEADPAQTAAFTEKVELFIMANGIGDCDMVFYDVSGERYQPLDPEPNEVHYPVTLMFFKKAVLDLQP
jgi:hypothetical protein